MTRARAIAAAMIVVSAAGLAGCDAAEQGRVLNYKKGVYLGPKPAPLDEAVLTTLRQRAALQAGVTVASGGGGASGRDADVRPPAPAGATAEMLRSRGALQRSP